MGYVSRQIPITRYYDFIPTHIHDMNQRQSSLFLKIFVENCFELISIPIDNRNTY